MIFNPFEISYSELHHTFAVRLAENRQSPGPYLQLVPAAAQRKHPRGITLSVGATCRPDLLETDGLFTQGSRPSRTFGESIGVIFEMDSYDWHWYWSNAFRYHIFNSRPDTEFKLAAQ